MSKRVALRQTDAELESQHRIARERLATASQRFERALAESERLKRRAQTLENDERSAAETNFASPSRP